MKLFNSLTRKKEEFTSEGVVGIYTCGPTVYDFFHVGNARCFVTFDALRRYMLYKGMDVTYVQNFTDIDDKLIKRAASEGVTVPVVAERYISEYFTDADGLNIMRADHHPRATEHIDCIIELIQTLIDKGHAYVSGGDVYFRARRFDGYGKLSHQPIEELESGARIDVSEVKEDPLDFALWKGEKPGEPAWDAPFGRGRPGWHIECSAMARRYLGDTIDIHCGGQDLQFPHHENEIAQSEAATGRPFARFFLHNGYINIDNTKMSKSLGNFFTVRDVAGKYGYAPIRFFILSAHYRSPLNYTADTIEQAKTALARIENCARNLSFLKKDAAGALTDGERALLTALEPHRAEFERAMDDDINTADAIAAIFGLVRDINMQVAEPRSAEYLAAADALLRELCGVLGMLADEEDDDLDTKVRELIDQRQAARAAKDFTRADAIRDELRNMGIALEDTKQGVKWSRV